MKQETRAANFTSQTIWTGDNLDIMRGMNSDSVDLIYLDPPFNSKANYAAPHRKQSGGRRLQRHLGAGRRQTGLAWRNQA